jgi:AcrR family transcriptional regulator
MATTSPSLTKTDVVEKFRIDTITQAAVRAIGKKGPAVTVQDVADEAGIAKGTVYLYFKDRDELLQHVNGCAIADLMVRLETIFARHAAGATMDEVLPALVESKLTFFDERRDFYRVHFELRYPEGSTQISRRKENTEPQKAQYLERLRAMFHATGIPKDEAARVALMFFESAVAVILRRLQETPPPPPAKDARLLAHLFIGGIASLKARPKSR